MRLINTVLALLLAVLVACLVWLMVHAGSVRPMQDDYLYLTFTSSERFQQSFTESFGQNGRLTVLGLTFVLGGLGLHWVAALVSFPLLAGGSGALMAEFLRRVTTLPPRTLGLASACTGALVALSFYLVTPSPYSVTYWLAGAPIHLWPYCLILLLASGYLRGQRLGTLSTSTVLLLAAGVLVVAMMSEMSALILLGLGGVATASTPGAWVVKLKRRGVLMLAALVGLLVVLFAPAAVNRRLAEKSKPLTENLAVFPSVVADTLEWLARGGLQHRTMILLFIALLTVFFLAIPVKFILRRVLLLWVQPWRWC